MRGELQKSNDRATCGEQHGDETELLQRQNDDATSASNDSERGKPIPEFGTDMINWLYFPKSQPLPPLGHKVVAAFASAEAVISSDQHDHPSNTVLAAVAPYLASAGFQVETGKTADAKVSVPVLFGLNGTLEKSFEADAYHREAGFVVEVEAGRGVVNNQFLKDLFQASMMHGVTHLAIAIRNTYRGTKDFERVVRFFDTLYASQRLRLPLEGILVIGY